MTLQEHYQRGFITKCAQAGVDPRALVKFAQTPAAFQHELAHTTASANPTNPPAKPAPVKPIRPPMQSLPGNFNQMPREQQYQLIRGMFNGGTNAPAYTPQRKPNPAKMPPEMIRSLLSVG